uniref:Cytidine deaminase n=1 Tax=Steinernema glaseri TaxID=37863 RepID=A0A1I7ZPQ6_9BILA
MTMAETVDANERELVETALKAMKQAYCPYSKFPVGAALLTKDGTVFSGVNVENASYGGTICAERSAVVSAVTNGHREFKAIAIATELEEPASPCGLCRQFLVEFGNYDVILVSSTSKRIVKSTVRDLLPGAFTPKSLDKHAGNSA